MIRLFVAIRPPAVIREQLLDLMDGIRGARWLDEDQLHLTLRFIGEVDRHGAQDVDAALASVHFPVFDLALAGLGVFDRRGIPATLWAGVAPRDPVSALHRKVDQALIRAGLPPERRVFAPHITLARLGPGADPLDGFLARAGGLASPGFRVADFSLYESRLTRDGALHEEIASYKLADQAPTSLSRRSTRPA